MVPKHSNSHIENQLLKHVWISAVLQVCIIAFDSTYKEIILLGKKSSELYSSNEKSKGIFTIWKM